MVAARRRAQTIITMATSASTPPTIANPAQAGSIGKGSTAASAALLLREPDLELMQLSERYGSRDARRMWQLSHDSGRGLVALL